VDLRESISVIGRRNRAAQWRAGIAPTSASLGSVVCAATPLRQKILAGYSLPVNGCGELEASQPRGDVTDGDEILQNLGSRFQEACSAADDVRHPALPINKDSNPDLNNIGCISSLPSVSLPKQAGTTVELSIVVRVYNEDESLPHLLERLWVL
jgi:hypothetical protein